jgi:hypothetical protein
MASAVCAQTLIAATYAPTRKAAVVRASIPSKPHALAAGAVTKTSLLTRLEELQTRAKNSSVATERSSAYNAGDEKLFGSFVEQRARMQSWWKEHLESRAALVQAACPDVSTSEEEEVWVLIKPPVEVNLRNYKAPVAGASLPGREI